MKKIINGETIITNEDLTRIKKSSTWFVNYLQNKEEKHLANALLKRYIAKFQPLRSSDFEHIKDFVYEGVLLSRAGKVLDTTSEERFQTQLSICQIVGRVYKLKRRLGLFRNEENQK